MSIGIPLAVQGLQPMYGSPVPLPSACTPPIGGQVGTGTQFVQGQALSVISTTPANEVRTLTLSPTGSGGGLSGNVTVYIAMADGVHKIVFLFTATTAQVQAAIEAAMPGWVGAITVTGTLADHYIVTFGGYLASQAIGGNWTATVTGGTATWARTTPGSSSAQFDAYDASTNGNPIAGFVVYDYATDYTGARITETGADALGQPATCTFFARGIFLATDLVGLDANAYTITPQLVKKSGTTFTELL